LTLTQVNTNKKYYQFNLVRRRTKLYPPIERIQLQSEYGVHLQNFEISVIDIDKIGDYCYDKVDLIDEYVRIIILKQNVKEMDKLLNSGCLSTESEKFVRRFRKRMVRVNANMVWQVFDPTIENEMIMNGLKEEYKTKGLKEGIQQGIEQGIKQGKEHGEIEITKKMLADGMSPDTIKKYVNLSMKEIKKIRQNIC